MHTNYSSGVCILLLLASSSAAQISPFKENYIELACTNLPNNFELNAHALYASPAGPNAMSDHGNFREA